MSHLPSFLGRLCAALVMIGALVITGCDSAGLESLPPGDDAPLATSERPAGELIPDQFVVVFHERVADAPGFARQLAREMGGEVVYAYEHALSGFTFRGSARAAQALERNPRVAYVEQDRVITIASGGTQSGATWGLDRIDQRDLPLSGSYTYETSASNVHVYILDSGIRRNHADFGGRVSTSSYFDAFGGDGSDGNGHGTHVAGTAGGSQWGVAKGVQLYSVRVLDNRGSGTLGGVIAGVDWVTANHTKPAVANMSLSGGGLTALDDAVRASIASGVTYVVAASNDGADACNYSPARVSQAITVGATNASDQRPSWSNFGPCVDLFAPGVSITSAWHTGPAHRTNTISGTSMAAPHVAGAAAIYLAGNPNASPAQVFSAVYDNTTRNKVINANSANNHLLYSLFGSGGGEPPPPPPPPPTDPLVANFSYSCSNSATCSFTDTSTPAGLADSWSWSAPGGSPASGAAASFATTFGTPGTYAVTLSVSGGGQSSNVVKQITCNSHPRFGVRCS